jgi:UDP-N-acetylmuramate dehydrogenase
MQVQQNYSLKKDNTFGLDVYAAYCAKFHNGDELHELMENYQQIPLKMVLGGGSNVLFTKNYDGLILRNKIPGIKVIREDEEHVFVKAGAGVRWHDFVTYCVENNFGGVENLSLIPGNVGASPMQNIGAYGVEIKDVFYELEAFDLHGKNMVVFGSNECEFGYRESVFKKKLKDQFAILSVTYRLNKYPSFNISYGAIEAELKAMNLETLNIKAISDAVIKIRSSKLPDPKLIGNAGSFFKNPVINKNGLKRIQKNKIPILNIPFYEIDEDHFKIPAGWLIEQCGWKGYRKGDAGCYDKQALVLVNYGKASGKEIYDLSEEIKISVLEKFEIELEREVNIM